MKRNILLTSLFSVLFVASSFAGTYTESGSYEGSTKPWGIEFDADDITVTLVNSDDITGWAFRTTENVTSKATFNITYGLTYYEMNSGMFGNPEKFRGTGEFIITGTGTYDAVTGDANHNMANTTLDVRTSVDGTASGERTGNGLMSITYSVATAKFGNLTIASNNTVKIANGNVTMSSLKLNSGAKFTSETDTLAIAGAITVDSSKLDIANMTTAFKELTVSGASEVNITTLNLGSVSTSGSKITTGGTSFVTVNGLECSDGNTNGPTVKVNDSSTLNLNMSQELTWNTNATVASGATFNLTNTHAKNTLDLNLADGATVSLSNTHANAYYMVSRWKSTNWGAGGTDKTTISIDKKMYICGSGSDKHTLTVGSNTEIKLGGELIIAQGKLVLNGSNNIKSLDGTQEQGDFLVLQFTGEKNATLSIGADNAVKSIGFTSLSGFTGATNLTPGTGLIELNGNEFWFSEFIEDENGKISFVDFDEYLVKFTGDEDSLSTNDDGSLKYIFAGADADQKLYLGNDGYLSLTATAVPEPAEWAMIFGAVALGFAIYRKRKNA